MDAQYILNRLRSTPYKYAAANLMRNRLRNLDEGTRRDIMANLKMQVWKHRNVDIHEPLFELVYRLPLAS